MLFAHSSLPGSTIQTHFCMALPKRKLIVFSAFKIAPLNLFLMRLNMIMPLLIFRNCIGFLSWNELNSRFWFSFLNILPVVLPHTLRILFFRYRSGRSGLRSSLDTRILSKPRTHLVAANKGFYAATPTLWDNLHHNIRHATSLNEFNKKLKTHLYSRKFHSSLL